MKILLSGRYVCKIAYQFSDEPQEKPSSLLEKEAYVICSIHTRKNGVWFHDVEICGDHFLEYFRLHQPFFDNKHPPERMFECFSGFLYSYDEINDVYQCKNQILKNTGGNRWNIYLKVYLSLF